MIEFHDDNIECFTPLEKLDQFQIKLRNKEQQKRSNMRMTLEISNENKIGFRFYSLVKKFTKPSSIKMDHESSQKLNSFTKNVCEDTGLELKPEDLSKIIN